MAIIRSANGAILFQRPSLISGDLSNWDDTGRGCKPIVYEKTGLHGRLSKLLAVFGDKTFWYAYSDGNQVE